MDENASSATQVHGKRWANCSVCVSEICRVKDDRRCRSRFLRASGSDRAKAGVRRGPAAGTQLRPCGHLEITALMGTQARRRRTGVTSPLALLAKARLLRFEFCALRITYLGGKLVVLAIDD